MPKMTFAIILVIMEEKMKDQISLDKVLELIRQGESDCVDFKLKFYECNSDLLNDMLCFVNVYSNSNRYIIFGVRNHESIIGASHENLLDYIEGVDEAEFERITTQHIVNLLADCQLSDDLFRYIKLHKITINEKRVLVLEIENVPLKPFFLMKDYQSKKGGKNKIIRAGVTYSRRYDGNTPINSTVSISEMSLMFRERFCLDKTPYERAFIYLKDYDGWSEEDFETLYYKQHPEYKIKKSTLQKDSKHILNDFANYLGQYICICRQNIHEEDYFLEFNGTNLNITCQLILLDNNKRVIPYPYPAPYNKESTQVVGKPYIKRNHELDMCQVIQRHLYWPTNPTLVEPSYDVEFTISLTDFEITD